MISSWLEYPNKEETEGENISSLTETKNGLKVTKGKEPGVDGQKWTDQGGGKNGHIQLP